MKHAAQFRIALLFVSDIGNLLKNTGKHIFGPCGGRGDRDFEVSDTLRAVRVSKSVRTTYSCLWQVSIFIKSLVVKLLRNRVGCRRDLSVLTTVNS